MTFGAVRTLQDHKSTEEKVAWIMPREGNSSRVSIRAGRKRGGSLSEKAEDTPWEGGFKHLGACDLVCTEQKSARGRVLLQWPRVFPPAIFPVG